MEKLIVQANNQDGPARILLEPGLVELRGVESTSDPNLLVSYLQGAISTFIAILALSSVIVIAYSGVEYTASGLSDKKQRAKERIWHAIWGLVLALSSYLILHTINPELVNLQIFTQQNG